MGKGELNFLKYYLIQSYSAKILVSSTNARTEAILYLVRNNLEISQMPLQRREPLNEPPPPPPMAQGTIEQSPLGELNQRLAEHLNSRYGINLLRNIAIRLPECKLDLGG